MIPAIPAWFCGLGLMHPRCSARTNAELQERTINQRVSSFITGLARIYGGYMYMFIYLCIYIYIQYGLGNEP